MIWILSSGEYSDYRVVALFEAPEGVDVDALAKYVHRTVVNYRKEDQEAAMERANGSLLGLTYGTPEFKEADSRRSAAWDEWSAIRSEACVKALGIGPVDVDYCYFGEAAELYLLSKGLKKLDYQEAWTGV